MYLGCILSVFHHLQTVSSQHQRRQTFPVSFANYVSALSSQTDFRSSICKLCLHDSHDDIVCSFKLQTTSLRFPLRQTDFHSLTCKLRLCVLLSDRLSQFNLQTTSLRFPLRQTFSVSFAKYVRVTTPMIQK